MSEAPGTDRVARLLQAIEDVPESIDPTAILALGFACHLLSALRVAMEQPKNSTLAPRGSPGTLQRELRTLVTALAMSGPPRVRAGNRPLAVRRALVYIEQCFGQPRCCLDGAARTAGISRWHLAHVLKQHTGYGFVWHLRRRRVIAAQHMLVGTPLSIKEIAYASGYRSATQLCRDFRQVSGVSPGAFRRHSPRACEDPVKRATAVNE